MQQKERPVQKKREIRWGWLIFSVIYTVILAASMFYFRDFRAKTGMFYRKRILMYMAPALLMIAASLLNRKKERNDVILRILFLAASMVLSLIAFQHLCWGYPWEIEVLDWEPFWRSLSVIALFFAVLWIVIWDLRIVAVAGYWLMMVLGYLYECVRLFRGASFKPMDILSISTAASVIHQYEFPTGPKYIFWISCGLLLCVLAGAISGKKCCWFGAKLGKLLSLAGAGAWLYMILTTSVLAQSGWYSTAFEPEAYGMNRKFGTLPVLVYETKQLLHSMPEAYDAGTLRAQNEWAEQEGLTGGTELRPNVIVIMNEAFTDIERLWQIEATQEICPFLHSLEGRSVYGNVYLSTRGGGTCNTEHSFLTGTIPPPGQSIPLFSTVYSQTPSVVWQMKELGYTTIAIHPYQPENYQRHKVYPRLGFDRFLSLKDFENAETMRDFVTDRACYDRIIQEYEQKSEDERLFVFNVTMQNHSSYKSGQMEEPIQLLNAGEQEELQVYANLLNHSDQALEEMISYFEAQQEPTVILLFGDHQPGFSFSGLQVQPELSALQKQLITSTTPFVLWANYPIENETIDVLSINYLSALLLQKTGLPMSAYDKWNMEMAKQYPVVTIYGYADSQGSYTSWSSGEWPREIQNMVYLRYNRLFDPENRLPALDLPLNARK